MKTPTIPPPDITQTLESPALAYAADPERTVEGAIRILKKTLEWAQHAAELARQLEITARTGTGERLTAMIIADASITAVRQGVEKL